MKSNNVRYRNPTASAIAIGILGVAGIVGYLVWGPGPTKTEKPTEATETVSTMPSESQDSTTKSVNPFTEEMTFERRDTVNQNSAYLEIKIDPNGEYKIKECISGEIVSKGVWIFDEETSKVTLTHIGNYPMSNVFILAPYTDDAREIDAEIRMDGSDVDVHLTSSQNNDLLQLTFVLSESTNVQYELLADGDVFIQKAEKIVDKTQVQEILEDKDVM